MFGDTCIHRYQTLWKVGVVVERVARRADSIARSSALQHLRESLKLRGGGGQRTPFLHAPLIRSQVFAIMMLSSLTHTVLSFCMHPHTRTSPFIIQQCLSFLFNKLSRYALLSNQAVVSLGLPLTYRAT